MLLRQTTITLLASAIALTSASPASACWLTDWLYGRPAANPYAVGYSPYAAGYAPVTVGQPTMLASGGVPVGTMPSTGLLAPATQPSYRLPIVQPNNRYSLQRPAYLDNPSVYTGRPVNTAVAPTVLPLRGTNTTSNPFYGTGNQYPTNFQAPVTSYQPAITGSIDSGAAGFLPTAPSNLPTVSAIPQFTTPAYTAPRPAGGLARFFGSLLGTNYRSSYYAAPITYYRPATSVDPITGTTVTVQRPCDSYVQQLQRTPYTGFQVAPSSVAPTAADCNTSYGSMGQTYMGQSYADQSAIGQVGAYGALNRTDPNLVPIPSTGDMRPLTSRDLPQSPSSGDLAPMSQPSLSDSRSSQRPDQRQETAPRGFDETSSQFVDPLDPANFADGIPADGQWRVRSSTDPSASGLSPRTNDLGNYSSQTVKPIPAPADYRSPYQTEADSRSPRTPAPSIDDSRYETTRPPIDLAPADQTPSRYLPPSTQDRDYGNSFTSKPMRGDTSRESSRLSVPVREASMERPRETTPIQQRYDDRNVRRPTPPVPRRGSTSSDWKAK